MRKILLTLLLAILATSHFSMPAKAQQTTDQDNNSNLVDIRLIPEHMNVKGGDEIWIGVEKTIAPHWHVYWLNPGDSGFTTSIKWDLPEGAKIDEILWPVPKRLPFGPLMNFGYEEEVTLLQKLKLPENLPAEPINLTADIELLVCKEECIPEFGTYTLTLNDPANDSGVENAVPDNHFTNLIEKLPTRVDWPAQYYHTDSDFILDLTIPAEIAESIDLETVQFFPVEWGITHNAQPQTAVIDGESLVLTQAKGERDAKDVENSDFVVKFIDKSGARHAYEMTAQLNDMPSTMASLSASADIPMGADDAGIDKTISSKSESSTLKISALQAIFYALLGGIILNLMPCVFPVLSIKALSLVKIADKHPSLARLHGLSYTAGVVLSFIAIAAALLIIKAAGAQIGWGFQLQNPLVIGALAYLLFVVGLNLIGVFEFGNAFGNTGNSLTKGQGLGSSFFTGVLATIVATPCTAPFMAVSIGFALTQGAIINLVIFAALGFGLALPYLLLSFLPVLQHILPKPGAWMNTFKEILAFPMFFSVIWLVWVISKQTGSTGVLTILLGMGFIGIAIWLLGKKPKQSGGKIIVKIISVILLGISIVMLSLASMQNGAIGASQQDVLTQGEPVFGEVYTPEKLQKSIDNTDNPIFVEMTAAWCITCKANHAIAINTDATKAAFAKHNVTYLVGDWTNQDPEITKFLNAYGRNGVPIYVYYARRDPVTGMRPDAKVLPQILTPGTLPKLLEQ